MGFLYWIVLIGLILLFVWLGLLFVYFCMGLCVVGVIVWLGRLFGFWGSPVIR